MMTTVNYRLKFNEKNSNGCIISPDYIFRAHLLYLMVYLIEYDDNYELPFDIDENIIMAAYFMNWR